LDRKYSKQLIDVVLAMVAHDVEQKQGLGLESKSETKAAARPELDLILRVLNPTPGACAAAGSCSSSVCRSVCVARRSGAV
jgi:hypothetical protein